MLKRKTFYRSGDLDRIYGEKNSKDCEKSSKDKGKFI